MKRRSAMGDCYSPLRGRHRHWKIPGDGTVKVVGGFPTIEGGVVPTIDAQATLVDPASVADGLTTTVARGDVEKALRLDEAPELVLDVARGDEQRDLSVSWTKDDLERLLQEASGDRIQLTFDRAAVEQAFGDDVEAHGLREKAAIFAVAVTAVAGFAGTASGAVMPQGGTMPISSHADPSDGGIVDAATGVKMATLTDGGLVNPATGVKVVTASSEGTSVGDLAPGAAAVGAAALIILG